MVQINWIRFTTILAGRIIREAILPLDSQDRANVLIIDNSMFERNRSKKTELLAKVYDHARHTYKFSFRMLTLGWSDGSTFLPINSVLLPPENKKNWINQAEPVEKEPLVINGVHFLCRKEHMPCWNSCHLLKKQPFLQNMSFLTAGFPLQAPYIPLRKLGMMSSE